MCLDRGFRDEHHEENTELRNLKFSIVNRVRSGPSLSKLKGLITV